jgi:hypothetical protein
MAVLTGVLRRPKNIRRHKNVILRIHDFFIRRVVTGGFLRNIVLPLVQRWLGHSRLGTAAICTSVRGPEERGFAEQFWRLGDRDRIVDLSTAKLL